jgi:hypothetical protein
LTTLFVSLLTKMTVAIVRLLEKRVSQGVRHQLPAYVLLLHAEAFLGSSAAKSVAAL